MKKIEKAMKIAEKRLKETGGRHDGQGTGHGSKERGHQLVAEVKEGRA